MSMHSNNLSLRAVPAPPRTLPSSSRRTPGSSVFGKVPAPLDPGLRRDDVRRSRDDVRRDGADLVGRRKGRGFTLLEVMIALLVIAIGMGAVINTTAESGWKSTHLRQSTIASWVAYNQIAVYRARRTWDNKTRQSGDTEMANAEWTWEMEISNTDDDSLRRIDVEVFLKGEDAVKARVTGFIGKI